MYTPTVSQNNLIHTQPRQAHAKPRGDYIISKHKDILANQKPKEKQKWLMSRNGLTETTTIEQR